MSDIGELLERLKGADPETFGLLDQIDSMIFWKHPGAKSEAEEDLLNALVFNSVLAGCIQRAIAARGWHWLLEDADLSIGDGLYESDIYEGSEIYSHVRGDTPAEAILAAYLAALEAMG